jgi:uncharacterized protein (DUF924 family)
MTDPAAARLQAILDFWFLPSDHPDYCKYRNAWFEKNDAFDTEIRGHFAGDLEWAAAGEFDHLTDAPLGALAVVLIFDQFPRNLFRGKAQAFAYDAKARDVARKAVDAGFDRRLLPEQCMFLYLPFEHSEDLADQERCVQLCQTMPAGPLRDNCVDYAQRHQVIIKRFGRFPHRNAALGRASTAAEIEFLKQPGSSF